MKKLFLLPLVLFLTFSPVFAQTKVKAPEDFVQQLVLPKEVYIGDKVQLQYTFNSAVDFFALADPQHISGDTLYLNPALKPFADPEGRYSVSEISLYRNGMSYTLLISFVPWITGDLVFPEFDLSACCRELDSVIVKKSGTTDDEKKSGENAGENSESEVASAESNPAVYPISIQPVEVLSMVESLGAVGLRPPVAPLLLPGTKYVLWILIVVGIILLFGVCFVLAKIRAIQEFFFNVRERLGLIRMSKLTKRRLKKLGAKNCSDAEFATEWQSIMRSYLDSRFGVPFGSVTTKRIASVIFNVTGGMLSDSQENSILNIVSLFTRTDYIIFAQNSIDSKQLPVEVHEAAFNEGERSGIVETTGKSIEELEKVEEENAGDAE